MRRNFLLILILIGFFLIFYRLLEQSDVPEEKLKTYTAEPAIHRGPYIPKVLIYAATPFFRGPVTDEHFLSACTSTRGQCHITSDSAEFVNASAVVFHNPDFDNQHLSYPFNGTRNDEIPYVWWSLESPTNGLFVAPPNFVNWTMYFTRNSDIWYPYGHFHRLSSKMKVDYEPIWGQKSDEKMALWIGSNCQTVNKRAPLMEALRTVGLKLEIFGACGKRTPKDCDGVLKQNFDCIHEIVKEYKFYMAIENSYCEDYVTEKFFATVMKRDSIPIVARRSIYTDLQIPASSYIAIDDFANLKEFVKYLEVVGSNKTMYLEFFKWKERYQVVPEMNDGTGFCALCRRLLQGHYRRQTYENLMEWQFTTKTCNNSYLKSYFDVSPKGQIIIPKE
ncbi:unnamed protein product, partial [Mesorhabditis belari]|uniref:Fucosyltransferase n=1 Tax=Mesorhabditis belari TaxID=2138241 RepID=A0AAF3FIH1_9BILA